MKVSQEVKAAFDKAKMKLLSRDNAIFITSILFSLKHSWDESTKTACTDGLKLDVNPNFFMSLSEEERITLLVHEAWHPALMHMCRKGDRNHEKYNRAGDYVINDMLVLDGYTPIKGWLHDTQFRGMDTNTVYDLLPDKPEDNSLGNDIVAPETPDKQMEVEAELTDVLIRAVTQSRMGGDKPGTIPGDIEIALEELLRPALPWNKIYRRYMRQFAKDDYSYRKPNRRFFPDYHLPGQHSESVGHLAFACDSSCSVTDKEFLRMASEMDSVRKMLKPREMTVLNFDTSVRTIHKMKPSDKVKDIKFTGRGGTNIFPVFEYFDENKPLVLTVFSDLECRPLDYDPGYPVIWVCINNPSATVNYGQLIHLETEK